ncbi:hypothetical protein HMPREF1624_02285 [Sporothrix schenckii ATCC 58251]|uniref:PLD phosphodiesterase domain-containing protein n=1 Tax=Sporothrix schenckii (strain ATCC 58251 / de Perez 2211183) TaxID=1391915 RepID=U7PZL8_SPOS1|nr:hypothetical protein HMPREF1624_02285 [Sporothrix schenckii ATCC 58251]
MAGTHGFTRTLCAQLKTVPPHIAAAELPAYSYRDAPGFTADGDDVADDPVVAQFASSSVPHTLRIGTGASVFASQLLPALLSARREILLVTCFWAASKSLSDLSAALLQLAAARSPATLESVPPLRIRICFSSRSLLQKLLHTSSRGGYTYPPASWEKDLGLPSPSVLRDAGIDLSVKSLFFLPFSVMHPKFMILDRKRAFLPSCNVSWEPWLEDCVEVTGDAVRPLLSFYAQTWRDTLPDWDHSGDGDDDARRDNAAPTAASSPFHISPLDVDGPGSIVVRFPSPSTGASATPIPTVILPSSHHRNPLFRPFPWQDYAPPPPTPLNLAMLQLLSAATRHIYIQSPNFTVEAVTVALLAALVRGIDVDIVTGERMMVYEQILTAGTTTGRCIRSFVKRYDALAQQQQRPQNGVGRLHIAYYQPLDTTKKASDEEQAMLSSPQPAPVQPSTKAGGFAPATEQPVQSHIKMTIVDGEHTVLGSGNIDRASFFTSQELGILFHSTIFAEAAQTAVDRVLDGRTRTVYPAPFSE